MTIADGTEGGKAFLGRIPRDILVVGVLILSATLAFGLGILAGKDMAKAQGKDGFWIEQLPEKPLPSTAAPAAAIQAVEPAIVGPTSGTYMASKNGTKYYLPSCGSAKRIKAENRVWFQTKAEAEASGYGPAANCPGL